MSPLLRDRYCAVLRPDRVDLIRLKRGFKPVLDLKQSVPVAAGTEGAPWLPAVAALREMIAGDAVARGDLTVVLSNHFVRYLLVPWDEQVGSIAEYEGYARIAFEDVFGETARAWTYASRRSAIGAPRLAGAIDGELPQRAAAGRRRDKLQLISVQPYLMAAFNRLGESFRKRDFFFLLAEPGRACVLAAVGGHWRAGAQSCSDRRCGDLAAGRAGIAAAGNQRRSGAPALCPCARRSAAQAAHRQRGGAARARPASRARLRAGYRRAVLDGARRRLDHARLDLDFERRPRPTPPVMPAPARRRHLRVDSWRPSIRIVSRELETQREALRQSADRSHARRPGRTPARAKEQDERMAAARVVLSQLTHALGRIVPRPGERRREGCRPACRQPGRRQAADQADAEAKTLAAMLSYHRKLGKVPTFTEVSLSDHDVVQQDPYSRCASA